MKILYITYVSLFSEEVGGAEVNALNIAKAMSNKGHEIHYLSSSTRGRESYITSDNIHVHIFKRPKMRFIYGFLEVYKLIINIIRVCKRYDIDIICPFISYPEGFSAVVSAKILKKPVVVELRDEFSLIDKTPYIKMGSIKKSIVRWAIRNSSFNISVSETVNNLVKKITKKKNNCIIKNSFNPNFFKDIISSKIQSDLKKKYAISPKDKVIVNVGNLKRVKNQSFLIDSFHKSYIKNNHLKLFIIGDGLLKDELNKKILDLDLKNNVILTGRLNRVDTINLINLAYIYAHTSFSEGFSTAILEAIILKKPILASDIPVHKELIYNNINGIVSPINIYDFSNAINKMVNDKSFYNRLKKSKNTIKPERFSDAISNREQIYRNVLREK